MTLVYLIFGVICAVLGVVNLVLTITGLIKEFNTVWMNDVATIMCTIAACINFARLIR